MGTKASSMETEFSTVEKSVSDMGNKVNTMEKTLSDMGANIARQQKSDSSRLGNKYKPSRGDLVLVMHTTRFFNSKNKFSFEAGLGEITSNALIHCMNRATTDDYLKLYGLPRNGSIDAKNKILIHFIGVHIENITIYGELL